MGYRVKGTLKLPDGSPASNAEIEFISRKNFSPLLQELKSNIKCSATGAYDVTLEYGGYAVIVYPGGTYPAAIGTIILAADTVAGQDLPTLLQQAGWQPATPEYIQQIAAWVADANASAASAANSAIAAKVSETNAASSAASAGSAITAHEGKSGAHGISGVQGLTEALAGKEAAGAAASAITAHEAKVEAHAIEGVAGLRAELDDIKAVGLSASAAVLDAERRSLERATGGMQTIIYDAAGNANAMFVLPRFRYGDLGMTADMGTGDVTAFDFGSGSIKSEIYIGAYLASGSGAVSAARQDPIALLDHTAARNACSAKGAGWHLMTAHEWAAIALWCMANGYEPIGNTSWGRSHAKTWRGGDRADNGAPGDVAGTGRTQTGSIGPEATHTRTLGGIADLVGNVWEWQDGFLLRAGQVIASTHNAQQEDAWVAQAAYFDAPSFAPVLANAISRTASSNTEWRSMAKSANYISNPLLKRLLLEPSSAMPQGRIYVNNDGERLPYRGGAWTDGAYAGLAALGLDSSRVYAHAYIGCRPAFA